MSMYLNIFDWADERCPFNLFVAGRGRGKTYSALEATIGHNPKYQIGGKFIWMRRTKDEWEKLQDTLKGEGMNPYKELNGKYHENWGLTQIQPGYGGVYHRIVGDDGKLKSEGAPIGYTTSLVSIAHMRGIDMSDVTDMFYDEFIPEKHAPRIRGEYEALMNGYETFNRNREFNGQKPIRLYMLANSNDIYNPIFEGLGIISECERMLRRGKEHKYLYDRGLAIHLIKSSGEFMERKSQTALYKLTQGSRFADMALNNNFAYNDFSGITHRDITAYLPVCGIDNITLYKRKGGSEIYCSYAPAQNIPRYNAEIKTDMMRFMREYGVQLRPYLVAGKIVYESYEIKSKVLTALL